MSGKVMALVVAAGRGLRAGGKVPKQYMQLGGKYVLTRTLEAFASHPRIAKMAVVINPACRELYEKAASPFDPGLLLAPVAGGESRRESVLNGLEALAGHHPELVLIHDAARPLVSHSLISRVIGALEKDQAALPLIPVTDTIKQVEGGLVENTPDRSRLFAAQTPQGFRFPLILDLHRQAARAARHEGVDFTDDASIAEWAGIRVRMVEGEFENIKLTTGRDLRITALELEAENRLERKAMAMETRIGLGLDVHRFGEGDEVILCGVKIPHERGLEGHSDADVAIHALVDAILGGVGAGDIGSHFPPSEERWRGAPSDIFLSRAMEILGEAGAEIANIDLTIICEAPKIGPHREKMRARLAEIMGIERERISVKATTSERLGFAGRGEGIAAQAAAAIRLPVISNEEA